MMMKSQIFRDTVPKEWLLQLLEQLCVQHNHYYVFDYNAFKKGVYNSHIPRFLQDCVPYYHLAKQHYVRKPLTYTSFTTVLRQICNHHRILYQTSVQYQHSDYIIRYLISTAGF